MTNKIDGFARQYLSFPTSKRTIIRHVYNLGRRRGLRILAKKITKLEGRVTRPRDLLKIAAINNRQGQVGKKEVTRMFRKNKASNGKKGLQGGRQNFKSSLFYQSVYN